MTHAGFLCLALAVSLVCPHASGAEKRPRKHPAASVQSAKVTMPSAPQPAGDYDSIVKDTHKASLAARQASLRKTVAKDACWIKGPWGETLWSLSALSLNQKTDKANALLLKNANVFLEAVSKLNTQEKFKPETSKKLPWPWAYFAIADYVRILHLFHTQSDHYPGRLEPVTETAMKEALWWLVKSNSVVADASMDQILVHHGTENHDLTQRPNYYLVAALFKNDPKFMHRRYNDGKTAAEHYEAYNSYFRAWPRQRAMVGLWFEMGSDTYQKYSWPALFNLLDLSPDPMVRKHFGMLLDLAFIEEAQVSFRGRRGGGRNRAGYGKNSFESYKNLLYAPKDVAAGCSHSKVIETSQYQLPAEAILLRKCEFPKDKPYIIYNRVPGEMAPTKTRQGEDGNINGYVADSALINYAYRSSDYLLGSTLQNPALSMMKDGKPVLKYSGISRQNRWSGMLFCDPDTRFPVVGALNNRADNEMCAVFTEVAKTRGGRPQHPHWSFQHENVVILQRITPARKGMGSYSTGPLSIRFHGKKLKKVKEGGWIFATNGKAFVGVKFLDGDVKWDEANELASQANHSPESTTRILMHAGDSRSSSFDVFRKNVLANKLVVEQDRIEYLPRLGGSRLECFRYQVAKHKDFKLPNIDGDPIVLRPEWTYKSPYLNSVFGSDKVTVSVGATKRVYDFGQRRVINTNNSSEEK